MVKADMANHKEEDINKVADMANLKVVDTNKVADMVSNKAATVNHKEEDTNNKAVDTVNHKVADMASNKLHKTKQPHQKLRPTTYLSKKIVSKKISLWTNNGSAGFFG